jgi:hypothetical protein
MLEQERHQIVLDSNQCIEHEKQQVVQWAKDHIEVIQALRRLKVTPSPVSLSVNLNFVYCTLIFSQSSLWWYLLFVYCTLIFLGGLRPEFRGWWLI